jgi:hypothetical protein
MFIVICVFYCFEFIQTISHYVQTNNVVVAIAIVILLSIRIRRRRRIIRHDHVFTFLLMRLPHIG